jgi:hypothetical protein
MGAWMEYLHMQQPKPNNTTGVIVHLTAIDPNGNLQDIGTTTSDELGNYALTWIPPVPGLYNVKATLESTNSYFSSEAGTAFVVSEATSPVPIVTATPAQTPAATATPIATSSPTVAPQPDSTVSTETLLITAAAIIIVVAVIAAALVLRKRK